MARADLTLFLPTRTGLRVYAEMMLTAYSQGVNLDRKLMGMVAMRVVRATVMGSNGIEYVDLPVDLANNSAFFDKCLAVEFRLGCILAEGYANANVWYHAKQAKKPIVLVRKDFVVSDRKTGAWKYTKSFVGQAKRLPDDELASQMALKLAAKLHNAKPASFTVHSIGAQDVPSVFTPPRGKADQLITGRLPNI
jgi:hypothetical protein